jgi:hypothetical protein
VLWRQHHYLQLFCNSKWKIVAYLVVFMFSVCYCMRNKSNNHFEESLRKKKKNYKSRTSELMVRLGNLCLETFFHAFLFSFFDAI